MVTFWKSIQCNKMKVNQISIIPWPSTWFNINLLRSFLICFVCCNYLTSCIRSQSICSLLPFWWIFFHTTVSLKQILCYWMTIHFPSLYENMHSGLLNLLFLFNSVFYFIWLFANIILSIKVLTELYMDR